MKTTGEYLLEIITSLNNSKPRLGFQGQEIAMKRFYALENSYGSETSRGFCNTDFVICFETRQARDKYVAESRKMSTEPITVKEIRRRFGRPADVSVPANYLGL